MPVSVIKTLARLRLRKNFWKNISVTSLFILAYTLLSAYVNNLLQRSNSIKSIVITYALTILFSLVFDVFAVGLYNYFMNLSTKQEALFSNLLYGIKNNPDKIIGVTIIRKLAVIAPVIPGIICFIVYYTDKSRPELFSFAGVMLIIAGGIASYIISLSLSQCFIILADNTDLSTIQVVRKSRSLMKDSKEKLFVLHLSFIPLIIFGLLTMYIGFFLIVPYYIACMCIFNLGITDRIRPEMFIPDRN